MKKFNLRIFMITTVVVILLNLVCWTGLQAYVEHDRSNHLLWVVGSLWPILRFPIFTFFPKFLYGQNNIFLFSMAVAVNCEFYAIIVERIFYLFAKKSKAPPAPTRV